METIIGKILFGQNNDSYMLSDFDGLKICENCGIPLERPVNSKFVLNIKKYDLSATYDGYTIASENFKAFCTKNHFDNMDFLKIDNEPGYFVIRPLLTVEMDHDRRRTTFKEYCAVCRKYGSIAGATPNFYKNPNIKLDNTIYSSDTAYGYKKEQGFLSIVNLSVYNKIINEKFKGVFFKNIYK